MARLFLASLLSEANVASIESVRSNIAGLGSLSPEHLRLVADEKLHLTLLFLGNLDAERLVELKKSLKNFHCSKSTENFSIKDLAMPAINFDQLEVWRSEGLPRHLVLTPSIVPEEFNRLALNIRDAFLPFVESRYELQAQRAPRPHVTIAHFKKHNGLELEANFSAPLENHPLQNSDGGAHGSLLASNLENPLRLKLSSLDLVESWNDGATNHYRAIERLPLGDQNAS